MHTTNGCATSPPQPDSGVMALSIVADGMPVSAAMLTDPKAFKKHLANGTSQNSFYHSISSMAPRRSSEPPLSFALPFSFDSASISSKDDAYHVFDRNDLGKNVTNSFGVSQATSSQLDPRQLLDPKGYSPTQLRKDSDKITESDLRDRLQKRSHEDGEGQGMGNLIERIHNVTHREERPRKRQKSKQVEGEDENQKKAALAGGGKSGEIGEYMKQKRKEGQSSLGPNSVVDLTGGRCSLIGYREGFKLM